MASRGGGRKVRFICCAAVGGEVEFPLTGLDFMSALAGFNASPKKYTSITSVQCHWTIKRAMPPAGLRVVLKS